MAPCKDEQHAPTPRKKMASLSLSEDDVANASQVMAEQARRMANRAKNKAPFTPEEVQGVLKSLRNVAPDGAPVDWGALESLLAEGAHASHKDWRVTGRNADRLAAILLPRRRDAERLAAPHARQMLERILGEGNWDGAAAHARSSGRAGETGARPPPRWAVLVTGVNGIRKTTSVHQPWFGRVLREALVAPPSSEEDPACATADLPTGGNAFFRQLDHMIATVCNESFASLYALTAAQLEKHRENNTDGAASEAEDEGDPPAELVAQYSDLKAGIFSRYRTLAELLGALLLTEARRSRLNIMCETSGRDVAMFHYLNHFFPPAEGYRKAALHFTIDDLSQAERSVDRRMVQEMRAGREALASGDARDVVRANAGGPYGSAALEGVRADSERVWGEVTARRRTGAGAEAGVAGGPLQGWYTAEMRITARRSQPWTIRAVKPDGSLGTEYAFEDPRTVGSV